MRWSWRTAALLGSGRPRGEARHNLLASIRVCALACLGLLAPSVAAISLLPTPAAGTTQPLVQGAYPNQTDSPTSLQSLFGTPTDTTPTLGTNFLPSYSWVGMDGATGSLQYLESWANSGDQLVLGVPIIPGALNQPMGSLEDGAAGAYDQYFTQLAETLVGEGLGNAYLRLGWEFDSNTYAWKATNPTQESYFAAYFKHIVTAMRAVSGAAFKFVWNPDGYAFDGLEDPEYPGYDVSFAWPGASYVDYIGLDLFDLAPTWGWTPAKTWAWIQPQLTDALAFASRHGTSTGTTARGGRTRTASSNPVPLAFPSWGVSMNEMGLHGMGDDPLYINNMYSWMADTNHYVAWESYFNVTEPDWNSQITGGDFPNSLAAFQADFGNG